MPFASQPYKTPYCNRHCQPLLKCPPGSHISSSRKSCVWHGRDGSSKPKGLLSSILGTSSTPAPAPYKPLFDFQANPRPLDLDTYEDTLRERSGSEEFGGGGRRRSRRRSRTRSKSRRRRSASRRRGSRRRYSRRRYSRRRKSSGRKRKRRSQHGGWE